MLLTWDTSPGAVGSVPEGSRWDSSWDHPGSSFPAAAARMLQLEPGEGWKALEHTGVLESQSLEVFKKPLGVALGDLVVLLEGWT